MTELHPVLVRWADAHAHEGSWVYLSEMEDTGEYIVASVGWLLTSDTGGKQDHVSICQSHGIADDAADHIIHILSLIHI